MLWEPYEKSVQARRIHKAVEFEVIGFGFDVEDLEWDFVVMG